MRVGKDAAVAAREIFLAENGGRPPVQVWGTRGMASSMHPLASQAAIDVLARGGNAVDAAVALAGVISVVSPDWAGPAGDSAWQIYEAGTGRYFHLDGYSMCAAATDADRIRHHFGLDPQRDPRAFEEEPPECRHTGVVTAMVPGSPAAWSEVLRRFGSRSFSELLDPAIRIAEDGFPVNRYLASAIQTWRRKLANFATTQRVVRDASGELLVEGSRLRQAELGQTLRLLAEKGHAGFYEGVTADRIVEHCRRHGGLITHDDLRAYKPVWREVIRGKYRGSDVMVTSPPTAGVHVLQALNILEGFELASLRYHGRESLHLLIEALKLALSDRRQMGGDPDHMPIDTAKLSSPEHAAWQRRRIDMRRASAGERIAFPAGSTTHFTVADGAGNVVNATQTIGASFGCGDVIEGTGLFMNDRTWWMSLRDGANKVMPGRRANIGHASTVLARDGRPFAALGSPGGFGIVQYVVQVVVNMVDYDLDIQSAIEAPRFKMESLDGRVGIESRIDADVRGQLKDMGHQVFDFPAWTDRVGGVEGLYLDAQSGHMLGGYDPRRNSLATGLN